MRPVLATLLDLLRLERIEADTFRGASQDLGWGAVFGGQVLGQALSAAVQTVTPERHVHSLHGYFLRQGDPSKPILYQVDRSRDGTSFATRRVVAVQNGRPILHMAASFQVHEDGFEHQAPMPDHVPPEGLRSERELAQRVAERIPAPLRAAATGERAIEFRAVHPTDPFRPVASPGARQTWCRVAEPLPDDPALHRYLLAYASDFNFLTTATLPHAVSWLTPGVQVSSLDHAMWFHRPFRVDEWLLYVIESPSASGARGLVQGRFYDQAGRLVASAAQEGLMRDRRGEPRV